MHSIWPLSQYKRPIEIDTQAIGESQVDPGEFNHAQPLRQGSANEQTDGHYQVNYLPTSLRIRYVLIMMWHCHQKKKEKSKKINTWHVISIWRTQPSQAECGCSTLSHAACSLLQSMTFSLFSKFKALFLGSNLKIHRKTLLGDMILSQRIFLTTISPRRTSHFKCQEVFLNYHQGDKHSRVAAMFVYMSSSCWTGGS